MHMEAHGSDTLPFVIPRGCDLILLQLDGESKAFSLWWTVRGKIVAEVRYQTGLLASIFLPGRFPLSFQAGLA
jgi:hypothetical protein